MIIEGAISVKSALFSKKRKINKVYIREDKISRDVTFIKNYLDKYHIAYSLASNDEIDSLVSGKTHGGIIADVENRNYQNINDLKDNNIFLIDGVEDPFNLAYIFRTLRAFNYHQVIMPTRDLSKMEAAILKSSAGAFDQLDIILSDNLLHDLENLKDKYQLLALSRSENAYNAMDINYPKRKIILLGGEKRGIKKEILSICNKEIFIEYSSDFRNALNASSALASIVTILEMKRRNK